MARKRVTNSQECETFPSAIQWEVAEHLAAGYSQNRTAALVSEGKADDEMVSQQVISYWWVNLPEFRDLVGTLRQEWLSSQRRVLQESIALAQLVYLRDMQGERRDTRATELATGLLRATLWPNLTAGDLAEDGEGGDAQGQLGEASA